MGASAPPPAPAEASRTGAATERTFSYLRVLPNATLDTNLPPREVETQARAQDPPPLDEADPRIARYFAAIKRRVEAKWVYPEEAVRLKQSGSGMAKFSVRRDGSLREIEIVHSTGTPILDHSLLNAIRLAEPFPSVPCPIAEEWVPITITFRFLLPTAP